MLCPSGTAVNVDSNGICPTVSGDTTVVSAVSTEAPLSDTTAGGAIGSEPSGLGIWPWVGLGIGLCVLLLIIIVVVVVVRRRKASARDRSQSKDLETHGLADLSTTASAFDSIMDSGGTVATAPRTNEYASVAQAFAIRNGETIDSAPSPSSNYGSSALAPVQYGGADFLTDEAKANGGTMNSASIVYGQL